MALTKLELVALVGQALDAAGDTVRVRSGGIRADGAGDIHGRLRNDGWHRNFGTIPAGAFALGDFATLHGDTTATGLTALGVTKGVTEEEEMSNFIIDAVQDYGADPTGATDTYTALNNAFVAARARKGRRVFLQQGTYTVGTQLDVSDIHVVGELSAVLDFTTIKATAALAAVLDANTPTQLENLMVDCDSTALIGINLKAGSSGSIVHNCRVKNATTWGMQVVEATVRIDGVLITDCEQGIFVDSANGSCFIGVTAASSQGVGLEVRGNEAGGASSGQVTFLHTVIDLADLGSTGEPGIRINGGNGVTIIGGYMEGAMDMIHIEGNSHDITLGPLWMTGGDPAVVVDIKNGHNVEIRNISAPNGSDVTPDFCRIKVDVNNCDVISAQACGRNTATQGASDMFAIEATDGVETEVYRLNYDGTMRFDTAPHVDLGPMFQIGQVVWSDQTGSTAGWRWDGTAWNAF